MYLTESVCKQLYGKPHIIDDFKLYTYNFEDVKELLNKQGVQFKELSKRYGGKFAVQYVLPFDETPDVAIAFCDDTRGHSFVYNLSNPDYSEYGIVDVKVVALTSMWGIK